MIFDRFHGSGGKELHGATARRGKEDDLRKNSKNQSSLNWLGTHNPKMAAPNADARLEIMVKGLEEVVAGEGNQDLKELLKTKEHPVIYWGTATTGKPHMGYFVPIYKISDFLAGMPSNVLEGKKSPFFGFFGN